MEEKTAITDCPYCRDENIEQVDPDNAFDGYRWHCRGCDRWFDEDECNREACWRRISALLDGTSEESPREVDFTLPSYEEEACGLSSLEIPYVETVFQVEGDGTMWYHIDHEKGPDGTPLWRDMSLLSTSDLKALLGYLTAHPAK